MAIFRYNYFASEDSAEVKALCGSTTSFPEWAEAQREGPRPHSKCQIVSNCHICRASSGEKFGIVKFWRIVP